MPNGVSGLNVRTFGVSRDQIMAAVQQLGSAYVLAHDDPELVRSAKQAGFRTIYRQSGDEGGALSSDASAFVSERAAKGGDFVYLTNEVTSSPALHTWTRQALEAANAQGVKLVIYNYGTNADQSQWDAAADNIRFAVAHGHAIGVHVYLDGTHDAGALAWRDLKHAVGGLWMVTEFGYIGSILDAFRGWKAGRSQEQLSDFMRNSLPFYANENMPVLHFSFDDWPSDDQGRANGFGLWQANNVLAALAQLNQTLTVTGAGVAVSPAGGASPVVFPDPETLGVPQAGHVVATVRSFAFVREQPSTSASRVGSVKAGDAVTYRPVTFNNNHFAWTRLEAPVQGWVASVATIAPG